MPLFTKRELVNGWNTIFKWIIPLCKHLHMNNKLRSVAIIIGRHDNIWYLSPSFGGFFDPQSERVFATLNKFSAAVEKLWAVKQQDVNRSNSAETSSCHQHSSYSFSCSNSWRNVNANMCPSLIYASYLPKTTRTHNVYVSLRSAQTESVCFRFASKNL